jgi:hypothetical protein
MSHVVHHYLSTLKRHMMEQAFLKMQTSESSLDSDWANTIQKGTIVLLGISFFSTTSLLLWQIFKHRGGKIKLHITTSDAPETRRHATLASLVSHIDTSLYLSGTPLNEAGFRQQVNEV